MSQGGAAVSSLESQRKGGLGDRLSVLPGTSFHCPLLPWLQVSQGPLEFRRCTPVGEEEGERKGKSVLLVGRAPIPSTLYRKISQVLPIILLSFIVSIFTGEETQDQGVQGTHPSHSS